MCHVCLDSSTQMFLISRHSSHKYVLELQLATVQHLGTLTYNSWQEFIIEVVFSESSNTLSLFTE